MKRSGVAFIGAYIFSFLKGMGGVIEMIIVGAIVGAIYKRVPNGMC
jgi:hypothetical protein